LRFGSSSSVNNGAALARSVIIFKNFGVVCVIRQSRSNASRSVVSPFGPFTDSSPFAAIALIMSSTSEGSFVAQTVIESPTSYLRPHPLKSISKWRVSFSEPSPQRLRLTVSFPGKGFVRL
jgi:hypothetical protein